MSRYIQLYNTTGTTKYQTLATSQVSARTSVINGRRITILSGSVPHFVEFGTSTVTATMTSALLPADSMVDYHFEPGQYVAVLSSSGTSYVTVLDAD